MTTKINGTVLIAEIAERTGNSRKHVKQILDAMAELTAAHVGSGKAVIIPGLVHIASRTRPARDVRNPANNKVTHKPEHQALRLTGAKPLRDALAG